MPIPSDILRDYPELDTWSVLHGYRGSISHGTYLPNSDPNSIDDKDTMAVVIPPMSYFIGLSGYGGKGKGTREVKRNEWDIVIYDIRKFIHLLTKSNPNVLMLLWLVQNYFIKITDAGQLLIDNRELFATKKIYNSYTGYASGQFHRMTHGAHQGHMGEKRKELVAKYGYDTKNASHLIRILRMGTEFLSTGHLNVLRPDAPELLDIKKGKWTLEQVKEASEYEFKLAREALIHSPLPEKPDHIKIESLCMEIIRLHHSDYINLVQQYP